MKRFKIILLQALMCLCMYPVMGQNIDREKAREAEIKFDRFTVALSNKVAAIEQAADLREIKLIAKEIESQSGSLLDEIAAIYPVDENYWLDAALDQAVANDIQSYAPHTANALRTRAAITTIDGIENEKAARPGYFERLRKIYRYCKGIGRAVVLKTAGAYSEKIKEEYKSMREM